MSGSAGADATTEAIAEHYSAILALLGEDTKREGSVKTPMRAAKALRFLTSGMRGDLGTVVNDAVFAESHHEMVIVRDIEVHSLCEHHMLPFVGRAHIAYLPGGSVIGLSKLGRIVDLYGRRLQVQERLTTQVAAALDELIAPRGVAVAIEATHMCMQMRGVQKSGASTITTSMRGAFREDSTVRDDSLRLIGMPSLPRLGRAAPSSISMGTVDDPDDIHPPALKKMRLPPARRPTPPTEGLAESSTSTTPPCDADADE